MITARLKDIIKMLDGMAPFSNAEEWDNPGFQAGFPSDEVKKALISLDPTITALKNARERGAQLLLTHHPLIFGGMKKIDTDVYPGDVIAEALTSRISIVSVHTNLDTAKGGINDILARLVGLKDIEALVNRQGPSGDNMLEGLGRIGYLPVPMPLADIAQRLMDAIGSKGLMVLGPPEREIKKVGILGGAGGQELQHASEKGADLYITGDVRHHEALMAHSLGLALIDAGHFNMERAAMHVFAKDLRERIRDAGWELIVETYDEEESPMRYMAREA